MSKNDIKREKLSVHFTFNVVYYNRSLGWDFFIKISGPPFGGDVPRPFFAQRRKNEIHTLSVFVDESGDFGAYQPHCPYYIFSLVCHKQDNSISKPLSILEETLTNNQLHADHCFHAGPIIRQEEVYRNYTLQLRRKLFNAILTFAKNIDIRYKTFYIDKSRTISPINKALENQLQRFVDDQNDYFNSFDKIIIYYDNGQIELSQILSSVFSKIPATVEFRIIKPADFRLAQVADLICALQLIELKIDNKKMSKSEDLFFGKRRDFKKNFQKPISHKRFDN